MVIAFDLDDTLIPTRVGFSTERIPRGILSWCFCREPLRLGTVRLFRELHRLGHDIFIYTSSLRSPLAVRLLFFGYGVPISRVINDDLHRRRMAQLGDQCKSCTKLPLAFSIDVLVDDNEVLLRESQRYDFQCIIVKPDDPYWTERVLAGVKSIELQAYSEAV